MEIEQLNQLKEQINQMSQTIAELQKDMNVQLEQIKLMLWEGLRNKDEQIDEAKIRFFKTLKPIDNFMKLKHTGNLILLKKLVRVANELKLDYWLDFGSLIGAVRHAGPIPWDDDVDICLPRDHFNKLIDYFKNDPRFMIVHWYMTSNNFRITKLIFKEHKNYFFVDIFALDKSIYNQEQSLKIRMNGVARIQKDLTSWLESSKNHITSYDCWIDEENRKLLDDIFVRNIETTANELSSNVVPCIGYVYGIDNPTDAARRKVGFYKTNDEIYPLKNLIFSNMQITTLNKYENHLSNIYGDYLSMPKDMYSHIHLKNQPTSAQIEKSYQFIERIAKEENL